MSRFFGLKGLVIYSDDYFNNILRFKTKILVTLPKNMHFWYKIFCILENIIKTSSSSSHRAISTDIPDPPSPPLPIASCRSSELHPVSAQSCCMQVLPSRPVFARPCEGVHWSTSLMISSLLLQQCPACLVRLTVIVFVMGGRWPYSCCFVGCCLCDLYNIARSILVLLPSRFFSICLVHVVHSYSESMERVHVVHPYRSIDTTATWKKLRFILSVRFDLHMTDSLSVAVHTFGDLIRG